MRYFAVILILIISCATQSQILQQNTQSSSLDTKSKMQEALELIDSIIFAKLVIDFCLVKQNDLLVLDNTGEKIFRIDLENNIIAETIILPQKIYLLKGIATDNFFIYLYTENSLYQYDHSSQKLLKIFDSKDRIKISDLTITPEGEIYISDDLNNQILLMNSLGKVVKFNITMKDLFVPAGIAYDNQNSNLFVINKAQSRIESYSRIGNITSIIKTPAQSCLKLAIDQDKIITWQNDSKNIYYLMKDEMNWQSVVINRIVTNAELYNNLLIILDSSKGIFAYEIK